MKYFTGAATAAGAPAPGWRDAGVAPVPVGPRASGAPPPGCCAEPPVSFPSSEAEAAPPTAAAADVPAWVAAEPAELAEKAV